MKEQGKNSLSSLLFLVVAAKVSLVHRRSVPRAASSSPSVLLAGDRRRGVAPALSLAMVLVLLVALEPGPAFLFEGGGTRKGKGRALAKKKKIKERRPSRKKGRRCFWYCCCLSLLELNARERRPGGGE